MRSRIIISKNGQTLVARGQEYVAPSQGATTILTSRQFDEPCRENRTVRSVWNSGQALERAAIFGRVTVSKAELKRQANLKKAQEMPIISNAEALGILESLKRADEMKARLEARRKELAEIEREERQAEARELRLKASAARLATLKGINKAS